MFGGQSTTPSIFGGPSGGVQQTSSLFASQPQAQPSLFGQQPTQSSLFGQQPQQQQTGLFGQPTGTPSGQTSLFGQPTPQTQSSLFGGAQQSQSYLYGGAPATPATSSSLFGFSQPATSSSIFGQPAASSSLFRPQTQTTATPQTQSLSLFAQPQQPQSFVPSGIPGHVDVSANLQAQQQLQDLQARLERAPAVREALTKLTNPDEAAVYRLLDIYERIHQLKSMTPDLVRFKWCLALVPEAATQMENDLLQLRNNPQLLMWAKQWVEANPNPSPDSYHLKVINGFEDLIAHGLEKKRQFELLSRGLENIHERQSKIKEELDYDVKQRLAMIRKKHWALKAKFLRCLGLLEDFAHQNQTASINADLVRQLDTGMHNFQTELIGSGMRTHVDTLRQKMAQITHRAEAAPASARGTQHQTLLGVMSERTVESVIDITDRQNDAFEALRKQVELDSKTVAVMVTALRNKSPSQYKSRYRY